MVWWSWVVWVWVWVREGVVVEWWWRDGGVVVRIFSNAWLGPLEKYFLQKNIFGSLD